MRGVSLSLVLMLAAGGWLMGADVDPYDQSGVPLEKQPPTESKAAKIVLVAGHASHGRGEHEFFAGCALLMKLLQETPDVFPVIARDGWPRNPKTFEGAKTVVFFMDGGGGHPIIQKDHRDAVQKLMDQGVGFVNLHYAVEYPKSQSDHVLEWLGGYYETGFSTNPHWKAEIKTLPEHPITARRQTVRAGGRMVFQHTFQAGSSGSPADLEGCAARPRARHGGGPRTQRPRRDPGLGLRSRQRRTLVRLHGRRISTATGATKTSADSSSTPFCGRREGRSAHRGSES